jgi:hypothetical protein
MMFYFFLGIFIGLWFGCGIAFGLSFIWYVRMEDGSLSASFDKHTPSDVYTISETGLTIATILIFVFAWPYFKFASSINL